MKILITGAKGFIGSELVKSFSKKYEVTGISRDEVDLTDLSAVTNFFYDKHYDVVIHCATVGGRRFNIDTCETFFANIRMFENLMLVKHRFRYFINFSSGAEFDRSSMIVARNEGMYYTIPKDYYGFSKYIISNRLKNEKNVLNIRIFSCFGLNEKCGFITTVIRNCLNDDIVDIHENKLFDFFYIEDLIFLVDFFIKNYKGIFIKELNAVYNDKRTLLDIYYYIRALCNNGDMGGNKLLVGNGVGNEYTGSSDLIDSLGFTFIGLEEGIKEIYNDMKNK